MKISIDEAICSFTPILSKQSIRSLLVELTDMESVHGNSNVCLPNSNSPRDLMTYGTFEYFLRRTVQAV
jgi:hypothetical protein